MKITKMLNIKKPEIITRKYGKRLHGQAMVEFAVSLVILLIILSGIIDLGRMFFYYIAMRDAAQEGVIYGITEPTECAAIINRTQVLLSDNSEVNTLACGGGVTPTDSTVCIDVTISDEYGIENDCAAADPATQACSNSTIRVTVSAPAFPISMPFLAIFLPNGHMLPLETSISGTILRPPCSP